MELADKQRKYSQTVKCVECQHAFYDKNKKIHLDRNIIADGDLAFLSIGVFSATDTAKDSLKWHHHLHDCEESSVG